MRPANEGMSNGRDRRLNSSAAEAETLPRSADPAVQDYLLRLSLDAVLLQSFKIKAHPNARPPLSSKDTQRATDGTDGRILVRRSGRRMVYSDASACKRNRKPGSVPSVGMLLGYPKFVFIVYGLFHY